jgi:tryptophan-rich sensory protein
MTDSGTLAALQTAYRRYIVAPTALLVYRSSAVLQLPYCPWGTLITALTALVKHRNAYSTQEHEAVSAYISLQVLVPLL